MKHVCNVYNCVSTDKLLKYLILLQDMESVDAVIASQVQPVIVVAEDLYVSNLMYVVAERNILCKVTSKKVTDGPACSVGYMLYIYNIEYQAGKNAFCFLDMTLMGIVPVKCPASVWWELCRICKDIVYNYYKLGACKSDVYMYI